MKYVPSTWLFFSLLSAVNVSARAQAHFPDCVSRTPQNAVVVVPISALQMAGGAEPEVGDEMAVLSEDGTCAGRSMWGSAGVAITVWGGEGVGLQAGDELRFAYWDASAGQEHEVTAVSYVSGGAHLSVSGLFADGSVAEVLELRLAVRTVPELLAPAHAENDVRESVTLTWSQVSESGSYDVQLSMNKQFASPVQDWYGLKETSLTVDSLAAGSTYYWRVRVADTTQAHSYSAARTFTTHGVHEVALQAGWNTISSYVQPSVGSLDSLFKPAMEEFVLMKDEGGNIFWPEKGVNTIGSWNTGRGYKVLMKAPASVDFSGPMVSPEGMETTLQPGWNLVGYLQKHPLRVDSTFAAANPDVLVIKNTVGDLFAPALGAHTLAELRPGEGYMVYVQEPSILNYPGTAAASTSPSLSARGANDERRGLASSAHFVIHGPHLPDGQEVSVWTEALLVGTGTVTGGKAFVAVAGDDPYTTDVSEGAKPGEHLMVRLGVASDGQDLDEESITEALTDDPVASLVYQEDVIWSISVGESPADDVEARLEQNYPNPFRSSTRIEYHLEAEADVVVEVFNTLGQRVKVLVSERQRSGPYSIDFEADDLASGVYYYRLRSAKAIETRSMTIVR